MIRYKTIILWKTFLSLCDCKWNRMKPNYYLRAQLFAQGSTLSDEDQLSLSRCELDPSVAYGKFQNSKTKCYKYTKNYDAATARPVTNLKLILKLIFLDSFRMIWLCRWRMTNQWEMCISSRVRERLREEHNFQYSLDIIIHLLRFSRPQ